MNESEKVCLTTFIYGAKYQQFIPFFIYSAKKAYPEYHIILFLYEELREEIKEQLTLLNKIGGFELRENQFKDWNIKTPLEARTVRWVLPPKEFEEFDYVYIVDIDMYYIREPIPLHQQHIDHMRFIGLPFSNIIRNYSVKTFSIKLVYQRLRDTGIYSFFKFIRAGHISAKQLSGLHFFKTNPYFDIVKYSQENLKKVITSKLYRGNVLNNDEAFLYDMIQSAGFDMTKLGVMKNTNNMLSFSNPCRLEFRPHHGIHLGLFRSKRTNQTVDKILQSSEYRYYIKKLKTHFSDPIYNDLLRMSEKTMRKYIGRLYSYYKLF